MVRLIFRMVPTIDTLGEHDHLPWLLSAAVWRWFTVNCSVGRETGSINSSVWGSCFFSFFAYPRFGASNRCFFFPMTLRLTTKIASEYRNTRVSPLMIFLQKKGGIHGEIGEIYISRYDRLNDEGSNKLNKRITPCEMKRLDNLKITWDSDRTLKLGDPYMNFSNLCPSIFKKVSIFIKFTRGVKRWRYAASSPTTLWEAKRTPWKSPCRAMKSRAFCVWPCRIASRRWFPVGRDFLLGTRRWFLGMLVFFFKQRDN